MTRLSQALGGQDFDLCVEEDGAYPGPPCGPPGWTQTFMDQGVEEGLGKALQPLTLLPRAAAGVPVPPPLPLRPRPVSGVTCEAGPHRAPKGATVAVLSPQARSSKPPSTGVCENGDGGGGARALSPVWAGKVMSGWWGDFESIPWVARPVLAVWGSRRTVSSSEPPLLSPGWPVL